MIGPFLQAPLSEEDLARLASERRERAEGVIDFIALIGLIYSMVRADYLLVGIIGAYLATNLTVLLYRRFGARRTAVEVRIRPRRAFPDQVLELRATLVNRKRLPLPWVRLGLSLPRQAEVEDLESTRSPHSLRLSLPLTVGGRSSVTRRVRMRISSRGLYRLGSSELTVVDPLGLHATASTVRTEGQALIYPRLLPLDAQLRQSLPVGDRRGRS
ncbi:repeat domain protein, partial [mine drainage metagenome]